MPRRPKAQPAPAKAPATPPASILAALDDPELFKPHFRGKTWKVWRAFLASLFGLPMTKDEVEAFRRLTGRDTPPDAVFREAALIVGRRGGKSRVLALIATFLACFRDYEPYLAPGEVAAIAVLAANRQQARSIFRYISGTLKAVPLLAGMVEDEGAESITLTNRVVIEINTASFRTTRGYSFAAVLCDEIAFWRSDETSANPDVEILRALRPGMSNIPGSILLLASSPYAKRGALYDTFRRHYGKDDARVLVWKASTQDMNASIDPAIIQEAYDEDPEAARAEYGAEFRDDLADFVTREAVDAVTMRGRSELPPEPGISYMAFCDPSGGVSDAMTMAIAHISAAGVVILDAVREARPPFDPEATVAEFANVLRHYGINHVVGDRYGGEWPRQRFREHGISYEPSARPKSDLYVDLLPLIHAQRLELLDNPRLTAQLVGLERRTSRAGKDSVDHAPGGHDDLANSVAGVLVGLDLDRRPALMRPDALLTDGAASDLPARVNVLYAVLQIGNDGTVATAWFAFDRVRQPAVLVLDFDVRPMAPNIFAAARAKIEDYAKLCQVREGAAIYVPSVLEREAALAGCPADALPEDLFGDPASLAISVASHAAAGRVKLAKAAQTRAETHPLSASLDFKAGDAVDYGNPLRVALLAGIAAALNPQNPSRSAPQRDAA